MRNKMNEDRPTLTKEFSLAEVLGAISGYLLVDKGFDRIQELIEWVAGNPVFTHQIPSVAPYIEKGLKKQFPDFDLAENPALASDIEILVGALKSDDAKAADALLRELRARWGDSFQVAPMQPFDEMEMPGLLDGLDASKTTIIRGQSGDEFPASLDA
jgi:hypothetical protein